MTRAEMLQTAEKMVCGHREQDYGSPEDSFTEIGKLWTAYKDVEFNKHDVAVMMALMKIARIKMGKAVEDSYVDAAGYLACAAEIATDHTEKPMTLKETSIPRFNKLNSNLIFNTERDVWEGLFKALDIAEKYGSVTVADLSTIYGLDYTYECTLIGWCLDELQGTSPEHCTDDTWLISSIRPHKLVHSIN